MASNTRIKVFLIAVFFCLSIAPATGQSKKTDRLEQYYYQEHYKMVYRKASRLMKNPQFRQSVLPSYYKAMSSFQLMQNPTWMSRNNSKIKESIELMELVFKSEQWPVLAKSHSNELKAMQGLFNNWLTHSESIDKGEDVAQLKNWILTVFLNLDFSNPRGEYVDENGLVPEGLTVSERNNLVHYSYEFKGIPYKWGGNDEGGFDCSGFTSHVFKRVGIELPRTSREQYKFAKTIHPKRAYMGDLVFFSDGEKISHVGILVNQPGESKKMIHSASSKGISVAEIEMSDYWKKRIVGYGRVIN
jgi:hypothetical protein